MTFHIDATKLRVFRKFSKEERNCSFLSKTRFIVLEHLLPTTQEMLKLLREAGAEIFAVVGKPYSIDEKVLSELRQERYNLILESYEKLESTSILKDLVQSALKKCTKDKRRLVILDVGGYFAKPLMELSAKNSLTSHFAGVVEDTTFGHNRYFELASKITTPIYSVARSALKEIEARFVGRDAVKAVDLLLRKVGVSLAGRKALVIGYGMIGRNVARTLKSYDMQVHVYDKLDTRNLEAFVDGFAIHQKKELLKRCDVIFSATGDPNGALSIDELFETRPGVALVSVGSKNTEFDIKGLRSQAINSTGEKVGEEIIRYYTNHSRQILVLRDGTAVNFYLPSIPIEVLDLVFAEILLCVMHLLKKPNLEVGRLLQLDEKLLQPIAHDWLRFVNS
uniref:S-adenosylhomocysteine hydrolase n=1 Tax=Candidatus Nitrotoga fabula TaxID=2182327 RepID=A0A2X0R5N7_9PROT|nr:S-adenosylhomocysteine hydrolase [Candidatus Nitrotoga fabula]